MTRLYALITSLFVRDEEGQGLAEYALILALIAIVAIVALIFLGGQVSKVLSDGRRLDLGTVRRAAGIDPTALLFLGIVADARRRSAAELAARPRFPPKSSQSS